MSQTLLHLTCADLHPGCPAELRGASTEELVLAYVLHRCAGRAAGTVELDELLTHVMATVEPLAAGTGSGGPALVGACGRSSACR